MRRVSDFEKEAVTRLMNRVVELRDRGEHDGVQLPGSSDTIPFACDLYGNLGALVFLNDGVAFGEGWIASSLSTKYELEDYFQKLGVNPLLLKATDCGTLLFPDFNEPENCRIATPKYSSPKRATHDSEYLLINFLAGCLEHEKITKGILYLLTERIPCEHCTSVIRRFQTDFRDVRTSVMYFLNHRTTGKKGVEVLRTAADFLVETADSGIQLLHTTYSDGMFATTPMELRASEGG